jgi:hypothetical protein
MSGFCTGMSIPMLVLRTFAIINFRVLDGFVIVSSGVSFAVDSVKNENELSRPYLLVFTR